MKKLKFVCFSLITILLLFLSVFSFNVDVKAVDGWDAPTSAKNYVGLDGKGIRLYILEVFGDENGDFEYANMVPVKNYVFFDGLLLESETDYKFTRQYFDVDLIDGWLPYYLDTYGDGVTIYDWDRTYVYFNVDEQCFSFEYHGNNYAGYILEQYLTLYDELGYDIVYDEGYDKGWDNGWFIGYNTGYDVGYDDGYDVGYDEGLVGDYAEAYQEGFKDGEKSKLAENNEAFYKGIEKWLVPAIITVIALGGFVTIAVRKRSEQ